MSLLDLAIILLGALIFAFLHAPLVFVVIGTIVCLIIGRCLKGERP